MAASAYNLSTVAQFLAAAASPVARENAWASLGSLMPLAHQSYAALLTIGTSFAPIIKSHKQIPISPMLAGKLAKVEIPVSL